MQTTGGWQFGFGGSKDSASPRVRTIRVVLLGQSGVGKTAIAVRFASRRFIGEYDSSTERVYRVEGSMARVWEVADPPGHPALAPNESRLRWADAVLLVYSITDRISFEETWRLRFLLNQARKSSKRLAAPVVLLLGNKADLGGPQGERMVSVEEGRRRAKDIEANAFHEISARESCDQVMAVFASLAALPPLQLPAPEDLPSPGCGSSFRLRASTDGSIEASRRQKTHHPTLKRRLSISLRGAPS